MVNPSQRRIDDRKAIVDILRAQDKTKDKIDMVIDFFRDKYGTPKWKGISREQRFRLFKEARGRCYWCRALLRFHEMTVEHILPQSEGGTDEWGNLTIAHAKCNAERDGNEITKEGFLKSELVDKEVLTDTP